MTGRNLVFTLYRSKTDRFGTPVSLPWGGWVDRHLSRHAVRGSPEDTSDRDALEQAKDGPAIVLGEISQGKPRAAANVRAVHALALDIEGKHDDEVFEALARINAFEWIAYTTHKHAARCAGGGTRLRVILPLIEPIGPSDHPAAWSGINRLVGGINDPATRDVGRLHFLPSTYDPTTAWAHPNRGHWLSTDDLPDDPHDVAPPDAKIQADRLRGALRRAPRDLEIKEAARRLLEGAALAEPGTRHTTIRDLTWWIASRFDDLGDEALGLTFNRSLEAMRAVDPSAPGLAEVVEGYRGAVEKQTEARGRERARQDERAADRQQGGDGPYDDEDLTRIAVSQGCEPDELSDRWIVQRDKIGTWFLDGSGRYRGPYTGDDAPVQAMRILRRAPVRLLDSTKSGYRRRALIDVVSESGGVAVRIVPSLVHQLNTFDATSGTMYEACCPLRPLEPAYDEAIDGWLRVFAGPHYGKLVDWLACVPDLTKIMCALYVDGSPGSGKTLLAEGLARLWTEGSPGKLEEVVDQFNEELTRCPLLLADEEIPVRRSRQTTTTVLRSMISRSTHSLVRKYKAPGELLGAIRLIIAGNNEFLLDTRGVSSTHDLEAVAQRFLYLNVPREAVERLEAVPRAEREAWAGGKIASHALWLAQNHEVEQPGRRFWVEGDVSQMHRLLMTGSRWNSLICEWLVRYLMNPNPIDSKADGLVRRGDGELLINDQALIDGWEQYLKTRDEPETRMVGAALRALSKTATRRQLRYRGQRIRYRVVDVDHLLAWSDHHNIGDRETMLQALGESSVREPGEDQTTTDELDTVPSVNEEGTPF